MATEHGGHDQHRTAASKPDATATQGPEGSSKPRQRGEGTASLPFSTTQGETPTQEREETHTQAHSSLETLSQPSDYSGVDFPGDSPDAPTTSIPVQLSAQDVGFLKIKLGKRFKVNTK